MELKEKTLNEEFPETMELIEAWKQEFKNIPNLMSLFNPLFRDVKIAIHKDLEEIKKGGK